MRWRAFPVTLAAMAHPTDPAPPTAATPLSAERVVTAALELTARRGLFDWSVRDLARELATPASLLYHHVGGKDLLHRLVVERVLGEPSPPDAELGWEDWFRTLLGELRQRLTSHPGTAKWLLLHGPAFPALVPTMDRGLRLLREAGFVDDSAFACSVLVNTALQTLAISDERRSHEGDGPRDHAAMMREFRRVGQHSPAVAVFNDTVAQGLDTPDDARAEQVRRAYFDYLVDTTIAGLRARLVAGDP